MAYRCARPLLVLLAFVLGCGPGAAIPEQNEWNAPAAGRGREAFDTGPYLIYAGPGEFLVAMRASLGSAPQVEYWVVPEGDAAAVAAPPEGALEKATAEKYEDLWVGRMAGLPIGAEVAYRIRAGGSTTPVARFRAGRKRGEKFRFAVFGDTRDGHTVHRAIVEAVAREKVDFVVHSGDFVANGGIRTEWDQYFRIARPLLEKAPLFPIFGNHDASNRGYFSRYFLHRFWAGDRRYYFHDWGDMRLVMVDAGVECRGGCRQYLFLERALKQGAAENMWMAMALHQSPYSSGYHGSYEGLREPVETLGRRFGAELVFSGHDHNYERTKKMHGITYVVSGSAGAPIRKLTPRWFSQVIRTEPHYVLVDVDTDRISVRAVNLQGNAFDSFTIRRNDPEAPK